MTDDQEAIEKEREQQAAITKEAWRRMLVDMHFQTVLLDLQRRFPPFLAAFRADDGFNPHAAAMREGNREVLTYIMSKLNPAIYDDQQPEKPTQAIV